MRRIAAVLLAAAMLLATAGCNRSPGDEKDGDLLNGWAMVPSAEPFRPAVGTCHETIATSGAMADYRPVPCTEPHLAETFHLGTAAEAPAVPDAGSAAAVSAYRECADQALAYLGGAWRAARLAVRVVWPSPAGWSGGARWFRCDAVEVDVDGLRETGRTKSLKNELTGASNLRLGCFNPTVAASAVRAMTAVLCTAAHRAEFVGLWTAPDIAYARQAKDRVRTAAGCRSLIAQYTRVPDDDDVQFRSGWISYNPTRSEWQQGERRVRCFLWFSDRTLTRSLHNAGPSELPVN